MKSILLALVLLFSGFFAEAQRYATTPNDRPSFSGGYYPETRWGGYGYGRLPVCQQEHDYWHGVLNYKWNCSDRGWFAGVVNGVDVFAARSNCEILTQSVYARVTARLFCY